LASSKMKSQSLPKVRLHFAELTTLLHRSHF